jgi:DNA-binding transcriptional LysR family regulator
VAREVLTGHARGMRELALFTDGARGVVRVAALPSVAATALPPIVAELRREAPSVSVEIEDTLAHRAVQRLVDGEADLAVTDRDAVPPGLAFTPLVEDRFHVVLPPGHPLAARRTVRWREAAAGPLVTFGRDSSIHGLTERTLAALGIPPPLLEAQNIAVIAGLVAAGLGVAAVPELVLPMVAFAGLESRPLVAPVVRRRLGVVTEPRRPRPPAVDRFLAALVAAHASA